MEERRSFRKLATPLRAGRHTPYANPVPVEENDSDLGRGEDTSPIPVLERDWADQYAESPYWSKYWLPTQDRQESDSTVGKCIGQGDFGFLKIYVSVWCTHTIKNGDTWE